MIYAACVFPEGAVGRVWQPSSQEVSIVAGLRPVYEFPSASVTRGWESRHGAAVEAGPWPGGEGLAGGDHGSSLCCSWAGQTEAEAKAPPPGR